MRRLFATPASSSYSQERGAGQGSFTALKMNLRARTNLEVITKFLPVRFQMTEEDTFTRVEVRRIL